MPAYLWVFILVRPPNMRPSSATSLGPSIESVTPRVADKLDPTPDVAIQPQRLGLEIARSAGPPFLSSALGPVSAAQLFLFLFVSLVKSPKGDAVFSNIQASLDRVNHPKRFADKLNLTRRCSHSTLAASPGDRPLCGCPSSCPPPHGRRSCGCKPRSR